MLEKPSRTKTSNRILSRLSGEDFGLLADHLEIVDLPLRRVLEARKKRIEHVYFIQSGFASVVANGSAKQNIEVGLIGREGMTGIGVILGTDRAVHETYMQLAGEGLRIGADKVRRAMEQSPSLQRAFLRHVHGFLMQTTSTALANGRSKLEERLARWLLMAHDRGTGDTLQLTHEFLGLMLGVQRPGVTVAVGALVRAGLITAHRSSITIVDRRELEKCANGTYVAVE
jgi:CRP-like cAMP-binding protein